ncbi:aromatic ring-hydroxylating dioxygenase subunit alpha [Amycolatopsis acidicola]|uniref:Aromatic ring-hydroxylating dioxygenase subunit alpha n=1 Tax=Amycolatopsis acidicola TaxID=2596893 RepID=A0A5N0VFI9_9PSEU|nr:aromatic ring-hydroxylating dioxygenase subunit alpha [Amycolatopsis acidicola]KAA9164368.1 aromatic ring-hydroxylating dioxygenase subunit alpha [Amycolatopsis acidicola]
MSQDANSGPETRLDEMAALVEKKTSGRAQPSYMEILAGDGEPIPDYLRPSWEDLGDDDIPVDRYLSKEFHDLEVEYVWRKVWQMACREEEIPEPGDHIVYEIANDSFIVVRTRSGEIKALQNACLHRGRILRSRDGRVPEFRCPFHGFTWSLEGQLKDIPCGWDFEHLENRSFSLPEAKVATWGGFVFINMDPDAEPLEDFLAPLPDHFKNAGYESRYKSVHVAQVVSCNWKVGLEAFIEAFHIPQTHPQTAPSSGDFSSQYDLFGDNVNRLITPRGVASGALGKLEEQEIYENYLEGRAFYEEVLGVASRDLSNDASEELPDGITARGKIIETIKTEIGPLLGMDLSQRPSYEVMDAIQYFAFPNFFPWDQSVTNIIYRFRPYRDDPDSCITEIMFLTPVPEGKPRPKPVPVHWLERDGDWLKAPELGNLAAIVNQDRVNIPEVQRGLKALSRTKSGVTLATYQESRIRHFHRTLMAYINSKGNPRKG